MIKKQILFTFTGILICILCLSGCTAEKEEADLKQEVLDALMKQNEIEHYVFKGSANIQSQPAANTMDAEQPSSIDLINMFKQSQIEWKGVSSKSEARMEADFVIKPHLANISFQIPVMIKDNKLYFNFPLLNLSNEEYMVLEIDGSLQDTPFAAILQELASAIDQRWYQLSSEDEQQNQRTIIIEITNDNLPEIATSIEEQLPQMINHLIDRQIVNHVNAEKWLEQGRSFMEKLVPSDVLTMPGYIRFIIDENGYLTELAMKLSLANESIELVNQLSELNQEPRYQKEIPEQTRSLNDIIEQ